MPSPLQKPEKKIQRYFLDRLLNEISMPPGAQILSVQVQPEQMPGQVASTIVERVALWALIETEADNRESRRFLTLGNEAVVEDTKNLSYIGTVQMGDPPVALHVFEELASG